MPFTATWQTVLKVLKTHEETQGRWPSLAIPCSSSEPFHPTVFPGAVVLYHACLPRPWRDLSYVSGITPTPIAPPWHSPRGSGAGCLLLPSSWLPPTRHSVYPFPQVVWIIYRHDFKDEFHRDPLSCIFTVSRFFLPAVDIFANSTLLPNWNDCLVPFFLLKTD